MELSIIIPVFNEEKTVKKIIESTPNNGTLTSNVSKQFTSQF